MKKTFLLIALLSPLCLASLAQNIINPQIETRDDLASTITKIETDKQYTIVTFEETASRDSAWTVLNKEIFIQTDADNKHYEYIKSENIPTAPQKNHVFAKAGDKLQFKVYFKKIPANTKTIDIIERAGQRNDGITYYNFYNISLTQSHPADESITQTITTPMNLSVTENGIASLNPATNGGNEIMNAMGAMGPVFSNLAKSMMDAQLDYYKTPGKITEVAKLNKRYFDALVKEGFTYEQAIKIITSESLLPKLSSVNK